MWHTLYQAFHAPRSAAHRWVDGTVWVLILASIAITILELTLPAASAVRQPMAWVDDILQAVFIAELTLRVATWWPPEERLFTLTLRGRVRAHILGRLRFMTSPMVLIDLLAVLAVYGPLRGLRALRLLRLLRSFRVFRYANPFEHLWGAFQDNALLFSFGFSALGLETVVGGLTLYLVEREANGGVNSVADGLWWALVTLTTVGFGDITPVTPLGRGVGAVLMVGGMVTLALFAGIVGQTLLNTVLTLREEQFRMSNISEHIVIAGYDPGARMLLDAIVEELDLDAHPVIVFAQGERPPDIPPIFRWVSGDPSKESELDKVRLTHAETLIVVGSREVQPPAADARTLLVTFTARRYLARQPETLKRRRPLYVVAEILDAENVDHARTAGADEVIESTRMGFALLAHAVAQPGSADVMGRVVASGAHSLYLGAAPIEVATPFAEVAAQVKRNSGALVIGVRSGGEGTEHLNPPDTLTVQPSDALIYLGQGAVLPVT